jgi:hypothetical protein
MRQLHEEIGKERAALCMRIVRLEVRLLAKVPYPHSHKEDVEAKDTNSRVSSSRAGVIGGILS